MELLEKFRAKPCRSASNRGKTTVGQAHYGTLPFVPAVYYTCTQVIILAVFQGRVDTTGRKARPRHFNPTPKFHIYCTGILDRLSSSGKAIWYKLASLWVLG